MERHEAVVVGAGPAGLSAAAMLERRGVKTLVLERDPNVAASWRRHYDRLHLHTVRWLSHLPGLRLSRKHGPWVSRDGVVRYLENYVDHHGLTVRTGVKVERIERADPDGARWRVTTAGGPLLGDYVVVATGYNNTPILPDWPGRESFKGELVHGSEYRNPEPYRGRDVLVVGSGNTGAEICVDLVEGGAALVRNAIRTPPTILLRDLNGMPSQVNGVVLRHLPALVVDPLMRVSQRMQIGDLSEHGLPPSPRGAYTKFLEDDVVPILDVGFARAVKEGLVEIVAGVEAFDGAEVVLMDGSRISPDVVIACTGYRRALEPLVGHLGVLGKKGRPVVHGARTHPAAPGLHFIGFTNPISGMFREIAIDARRIGRAVAADRHMRPRAPEERAAAREEPAPAAASA